MRWTIGLLLATGMIPSEKDQTDSFDIYDSYKQAYQQAQRQNQPLLLILKSGSSRDSNAISLAHVRKTRYRRNLLRKYIVAVIDIDTKHGKRVHDVFGNPELPRVVVIDKQQEFQVFRTSKELQGEDWNRILETFQDGEYTASLDLDQPEFCPT